MAFAAFEINEALAQVKVSRLKDVFIQDFDLVIAEVLFVKLWQEGAVE